MMPIRDSSVGVSNDVQSTMTKSEKASKIVDRQGKRIQPSQFWYEFFRPFVRVAWSLLYWVRFSGQQNIPEAGAVLVVANHQSHFDPPLVGAGIKRQMRYFARASLFRFGPFRWLISSLGAIPVDVEGSPVSGVRESLRQLKEGHMLLIFPEGSRTWDGEIGPFRPGFALLARKSGAVVLPVAVEGAYHAWPRWRAFPRLGMMHVHYCRPLLPEEIRQMEDQVLLEEVRRRISEAQSQLRGRPILRDWHRLSRQLGWSRIPPAVARHLASEHERNGAP